MSTQVSEGVKYLLSQALFWSAFAESRKVVLARSSISLEVSGFSEEAASH